MTRDQLIELIQAAIKETTVSTGAGTTYEPLNRRKTKKLDKEPKLAAGKIKDNYAVSHFGYTPAPSIPNRKSGMIDYKKIFEESSEEAYVPDNIKKFAQRKGITDTVNQVARWAEKMGKKIVGGTAIGKDYSTLILDLTYQGGEIRINVDTDEIEVNDQDVVDYESFADAIDSLSEPLNENYARFRNETSKRNAPEQLHKAVKAIKRKLEEVNKLVEYTQRLREEVAGIEEVKYNTHTVRALEQIQEMIRHTYIKAKKLK